MESIGKLNDPVRIMKRAIKFTSKDAERPALQAVFLAGNGDVVSTDSYRLAVEHGAWKGDELAIDYPTAHDIAQCKVKGNDGAAEFFRDGEKLVVKMPDGTEIIGAEQVGQFPRYAALFDLEPKTTAYVTKQVKPLVEEHARMGQNVRFDVADRDLMVSGMGLNGAEPTGRFEKWCDGEDASIGFDPKLLKPILAELKWDARIHITASTKPAIITPFECSATEFLLMPVRLGGKVEQEEAKQARKERDMEKVRNEQVDKAVLMAALHHQAIDLAANDPDSKVEGGKLTNHEHELIWRLARAERLTKEIAGDLIAWSLDGEFVCCIERRRSKRKIHLTYPELKPICHRANLVAERKDKATDETPEAPKAEAPEPPAPPEQSPAVVEAAIVVSSETMTKWCEERGLTFNQKREGCPMWVHGASKPYKDELLEMGFRWGCSKTWGKGWYRRVA